VRGRLLTFALGLPEAWEDHPWDDTVVKVHKKIFLFLGAHGIAVKLPASSEEALAVDGAAPMGYGLGRAGWVSIPFGPEAPPASVLCDWVEESYRAVAPKALSRLLDVG
jgi:predicted DNA-binding protein (MmcQ/YjbR family)